MGFVYLMKGHGIAEGLYKVGISDDVELRLRGLAGYPFDITLLVKFPVTQFEKVESLLHKKLDYCRVRGEWFRLADEVVSHFVFASDVDSLLAKLCINADCLYAVGSSARPCENTAKAIFQQFLKLEGLKRKRYTGKDIASAVGLSAPLAVDLLNGRVVAYTDGTMAALLTFFANEGMPITPNDLFIVEPSLPTNDAE